jgi:hypothetical protein
MSNPNDLHTPDDLFAPPTAPVLVFCLHCQRVYESYLIHWKSQQFPNGQSEGFWRCGTPDCDGIGYEFDIFPVDHPMLQPPTDDPDVNYEYDDADIADEVDRLLEDATLSDPPNDDSRQA